MEVRFEDIAEKKLVGMRLTMTYANNRTTELWKGFMPKRKGIDNAVSDNLYALQIYPVGAGPMSGNTNTPFEKWAAIEVNRFPALPTGMEKMILPAGKYAVFIHLGPASAFMKTFHFIFNEWLPASEFEVDDRPHFEILPPGYRPDDPLAKEEVWIPLKYKT